MLPYKVTLKLGHSYHIIIICLDNSVGRAMAERYYYFKAMCVVGSNPTGGAISEKFTCLTREIKQRVKQERVFSRCVIPSLAINKDE